MNQQFNTPNNLQYSLNTSSLKQLVENIKLEVCDKYKREYHPVITSVETTRNEFMGCCVPLNFLLFEKLNELGIKTNLVGGKATFGVNNNAYGVVEYGYIGNMDVLTCDGKQYDGTGFLGHCWLELEELDVVIDLSLMHLKDLFLEDNANRGIVDYDYLLDLDKLVLETSQIIDRSEIISGSIGYHYSKSKQATIEVLGKVEALKLIALHS